MAPLVVLALLAGAAPAAADSGETLVRGVTGQGREVLFFVSPSGAVGRDPAHAGDVRRSAEWLVEALRRTGFPTVEVWETPVLPAVFRRRA